MDNECRLKSREGTGVGTDQMEATSVTKGPTTSLRKQATEPLVFVRSFAKRSSLNTSSPPRNTADTYPHNRRTQQMFSLRSLQLHTFHRTRHHRGSTTTTSCGWH